MENMEENSEKIGNIWKESKLNSEKIGKIQQSVYSPPPRQTTWKNIPEIVLHRYRGNNSRQTAQENKPGIGLYRKKGNYSRQKTSKL